MVCLSACRRKSQPHNLHDHQRGHPFNDPVKESALVAVPIEERLAVPIVSRDYYYMLSSGNKLGIETINMRPFILQRGDGSTSSKVVGVAGSCSW